MPDRLETSQYLEGFSKALWSLLVLRSVWYASKSGVRQKLAPSHDLFICLYAISCAIGASYKTQNFSAIPQRFSGHFRKNAEREYATLPHPLARSKAKCHFRWKVVMQKVIKWSLVQWCNVPRQLPPVRISVSKHLNRADPSLSDLS